MEKINLIRIGQENIEFNYKNPHIKRQELPRLLRFDIKWKDAWKAIFPFYVLNIQFATAIKF